MAGGQGELAGRAFSVSPVPIEKSADLEMDGSGESGGFSRTVGGRIAYRSKDAGHT